MSWKDLNRANMTVQAMMNILEREGYNPSLCLKGTGLSVEDLLNSETKIEDQVEVSIIEKALDILPEKAGYGLTVGQSLRITNFGIWGFAILTSPDVRSAFETMSRYSEMSIMLSKASMEQKGDEVYFVLNMDHLPKKVHEFMFERYYIMIVNFLKEMLPDYPLSEFKICLPFSNYNYENQLKSLTGLCIYSRQKNYSIVANKALLDAPFPKTDPLAHSHFISECDGMLKSHKSLPDYAQRVREYIIRESIFSPKLEKVAESLCISDRTLKRRLQEERHSFSEVVLDTKMALAKELLDTACLPVKVVSARLGYSEPSSFMRAFKKWWGVSPAKVKEISQSKECTLDNGY